LSSWSTYCTRHLWHWQQTLLDYLEIFWNHASLLTSQKQLRT
jgi:hypothetical protein